jgi:leucyl aminopeptidase (aminopeptidase T)
MNSEISIWEQSDYIIEFVDKIRHKVSEKSAHIIDELWAKHDDTTFKIKGERRRTKDIKAIYPYKEDGFREASKILDARMEAMIKDAENADPKKAEFWKNHIKKNEEVVAKGGHWQFADKNGKPCTKEEAEASIFGSLYGEAQRMFK